MVIKIIGSEDKKKQVASLTPSTRNLQQFISPNPKDTNSILYFKEGTTKELEQKESDFAAWEDKESSALIIDTRLSPPIKSEDYLHKIKETVTCPFFRWQDIKEQDDMFDARLLGFDGQITSVANIKKAEFANLFKLAKSIHFELIPVVATKEDWKTVVPLNPKFMYIEESINEIPIMVKEGNFFLIGQKSSTEKFGLKCFIEPISS